MADVRHLQILEQIRDGIGFPVGFPGLTASGVSAVAGELARLNTTASLYTPFIGQTASNVSAAAGQLATLNTTASLIESRIFGNKFSQPIPSEYLVPRVTNPAAGNNTLQSAPIGSLANMVYKIRMAFIASHATAKEISFRDGTSGTTYFTAIVPNGNFNWDIDLPGPWAQTTNTAAVCFVATGFSAVGHYEVMLQQKNPSI